MIEKAWVQEYELHFIKPAKTSRDVLEHKTSFYLFMEDEKGKIGIGECAPIFGLSVENEDDLRTKITEVIYRLNHKTDPGDMDLKKYPSLSFALDCAFRSMSNEGDLNCFDNDFSKGKTSLPINGLIWMDDLSGMMDQVRDKVERGFSCIKLKIGSHDFQLECDLLSKIRQKYGSELELRLDANGAFQSTEVLEKLEILSNFNIHSIEQPIKAGQREEMAKLCLSSAIPIALDEELIGLDVEKGNEILSSILPHYIILKPSLIGNFETCDKWISAAEALGIKWWATSALESNIGLSYIAQWIANYNTGMFQGLGTGQIYRNNHTSPLELDGQMIRSNPSKNWDLSGLL